MFRRRPPLIVTPSQTKLSVVKHLLCPPIHPHFLSLSWVEFAFKHYLCTPLSVTSSFSSHPNLTKPPLVVPRSHPRRFLNLHIRGVPSFYSSHLSRFVPFPKPRHKLASYPFLEPFIHLATSVFFLVSFNWILGMPIKY